MIVKVSQNTYNGTVEQYINLDNVTMVMCDGEGVLQVFYTSQQDRTILRDDNAIRFKTLLDKMSTDLGQEDG